MENAGSSIISALGAGSGVDFIRLADDISAASFAVQRQSVENRRTSLEAQVSAAARGVVAGQEHRVLKPFADEIVLEAFLGLQVPLLVPALHLVERRLGDEQMAGLDDRQHLPVEEGEQQRADMRAVHVRVRHDDDLVIA